MELNELLRGILAEEQLKNIPITNVTHITSDSRAVTPGALFVALRGSRQDGHHFLHEAAARGACFILGEDKKALSEIQTDHAFVSDTKKCYAMLLNSFYHFPSQRVGVIGITGTNGKTTTSLLIQHLLRPVKKTGLIGTLYGDTGESRVLLNNTTPDFSIVNDLLSQMNRQGVQYCAMEVSSHALRQRRLLGCQFQVRVFLNLTHDHLDYHLSMEDYYESKKLLFSDGESKALSLINIDDPYGLRLFEEISGPKLSFGTVAEADYRAARVRSSLEGLEFEFIGPQGKGMFHSPLPCSFNLYNSLAAMAVAVELGVDLSTISRQLAIFSGAPGRMERVPNPYGIFAFVDYAHTPDAFKNVLSQVRRSHTGDLITVFGCGGDRDRKKRPLMGEFAGLYSDHVIVTSDNPRTESPGQIIEDILKGMDAFTEQKDIRVIHDREEAIYAAFRQAKKGSMVLILGKGHEDYQIIGETKIPFKDKEVARKAMEFFYAYR